MSYALYEFDRWTDLVEEVLAATGAFERRYGASALPFFRGHSASGYRLLPTLFRPVDGYTYQVYDERNFYFEFRARAGALLSPSYSSWDLLFLMQHHGVPTRLLDWTESFATALYFALEGATGDLDVWMLNPYQMNLDLYGSENIVSVDADLGGEYYDLFIDPAGMNGAHLPWPAAAIYPRRQIARLASQHGLFTLHCQDTALEDLGPAWLTRFQLKAAALDEARRFMRVMGVNDFSMFPDLDGLSRFLKKRIRGGYGVVE